MEEMDTVICLVAKKGAAIDCAKEILRIAGIRLAYISNIVCQETIVETYRAVDSSWFVKTSEGSIIRRAYENGKISLAAKNRQDTTVIVVEAPSKIADAFISELTKMSFEDEPNHPLMAWFCCEIDPVNGVWEKASSPKQNASSFLTSNCSIDASTDFRLRGVETIAEYLKEQLLSDSVLDLETSI